MAQGQQIPPTFSLLFIIIGIIAAPGCANIIPPAGGPRDSLPPVLLKATPPDSSRHFSGNRVSFSFNEFIEVQNPQEFVITPLLNNNPTVDYRLNTVSVRWKDTLEPNTTYTLDFGNIIRDYNEGNTLKDFRYTFSTGAYIDSLELRGSVVLAETGKIDSTLIVMLHSRGDDSAVVKERPRYIAKLDSRGNFVFSNLPPKTFYIYALKDEGGLHRYFRDDQLFAFADSPVHAGGRDKDIQLYAYAVKASTQPLSGLTTVGPRRTGGGNAADKRLRFTTNLAGGQQDLLTGFQLNTEQPLKSFDSTKIRLYMDTTYGDPGPYSFRLDSSRRIVTLHYEWKENTEYRIVLDKDFAEDSSGRKLLKTDTLSFKTKKRADYGSLKLELRKIEFARHPVLQIVSADKIYKSIPMTNNTVSLDLLPPGEYELRILYDDNNNGRWDPGDFFGKHRQPEIVKPIERKISVKSGFANEFEVSL